MKPLHYKTHTLAKRFLSLLCVLALCLGLLPVTALAAGGAPSQLYVGDQQVSSGNDITYWTTDTSGGLVSASESDSWNVKYDPTSATLTLSGATIKGGSDVVSIPFGAGIYALSSSGQPVVLTIELIGENTITGNYGIYVDAQQGGTVGTNASLLIQNSDDDGSLEVSGSSYGIYVKSGTGDASLTIKNASVDAKTTQIYSSYAGVCVQSGASTTDSPNISLSFNGGSLTASASEGNDGIQFYVGNSSASATTSLTVSENAIVDARNGGISASGISETLPTPTPTGNNSSGIVFDGTEGTVYGDVELQEDLEIGEGETLTIPSGSSLTVPSGTTLTNNGTVTTEGGGTLTNNGKIDNSGTLPDNIQGSAPPKITTASLPNGEVGTAYSQPLAATGNDTITWSVSGTLPAGLTLNGDGTITGTPTAAGASTFTVTATNDSGSDSKQLTLTVTQPVTGVMLDQSELALYTGGSATLSATVTPENATNTSLTWASDAENIATVDQSGNVKAVGAGTATITATAADGSGISATCTVTVTDKTYTISADTTALDFGSAYTGYTQPAAQTVTLTNTGNQRVTLDQPAAENFEIGKLSAKELAPNTTATFTIQPKDKLPRGSYSEQITITGDNNVSATLTASFTVKEPPYTGKYSYELTTSVGDHGSLTVDRYATEGEKVTITVTPDEAYKLDDLSVTAGGKEVTLTAGGDGTFSFTMPSADVKITATFAKDPDWTEPEEPATDVSDIFLDIAANAWYKDAVQYAYDSGLMTGVSANEFAPEATTTRAMIVSMLARLEGVESAESAGFTDVAANDWYATAVNWAAASGITSGTGDGNFSPNTAITREQLAAILMNYAQYKGQDVSARATLDIYNDATAISSWANDVMSWAVAEGLLTGVTNDQLQPQGNATRAQVAAILERFLDN